MTPPPMDTSDVVAVPLDRYWQLVRVDRSGALDPVVDLPVSPEAAVSRDDEGRWWALDAKARHVEGFVLDDDRLRPIGRWTLPIELAPKDVAASGDRLFVGGGTAWMDTPVTRYGPRIFVSSVAAPTDPWVELECVYPIRLGGHSKAIDALVVDGDRLVAIDDVVMPKYLYTYDLAVEGVPVWTWASRFISGANQTILPTAARGPRWIAVASESGTRMGFSRMIMLLPRERLEVCAVVEESRGPPGRNEATGAHESMREIEREFRWHSLALAGDVLGFAGDTRGFGWLDCREAPTRLPTPQTVTRNYSQWDPATGTVVGGLSRTEYVTHARIMNDQVRWVAARAGHRVVGVAAVEARGGFVLVEEDGAGARSLRWFPVPSVSGP